jgi:hypothetical protein
MMVEGHEPGTRTGRDRLLIHFEIQGEERWESLGSGESSGEVEPLQGAIDDLRKRHGGALPPGVYRYIVSRGDDARWEEFDLGPQGIPVFRFDPPA